MHQPQSHLAAARGSTVALHRQSRGTRGADTENHGRGDRQRRMVDSTVAWTCSVMVAAAEGRCFCQVPRAGRCRFLACSVSDSGPRQSGDRLHRRMPPMPPMSLGLPPSSLPPPPKKTKRKKKQTPPGEGRGEWGREGRGEEGGGANPTPN